MIYMFLSEINIGFLKNLSNKKVITKNNYLYIDDKVGFKIVGYLDISTMYHEPYEPISHVVLVEHERYWNQVNPLNVIWYNLREPLISELKSYKEFQEEWSFGEIKRCRIRKSLNIRNIQIIEFGDYLVFAHQFTIDRFTAIANYNYKARIVERDGDEYTIEIPITLVKI